MDSRRTPNSVGANVRAAITAAGISTDSVAQATHIDASAFEDRLANRESFDVAELVNVGGFLRIAPSSLLAGVTL